MSVTLNHTDLGPSQKPQEIGPAAAVIATLHPSVVVEVGAYTGASLRVWAQCATDDAWLIAVEPDAGRVSPFARPTQRGVVLPLPSDQCRPALDELLAGRRVDFLFIDGDHSRALADFETLVDLVRPGGIVGFHDIAHLGSGFTTVSDWGAVLAKYPAGAGQTFVYDGDTPGLEAMGIGLLTLPS